jgi:hypothetical protein
VLLPLRVRQGYSGLRRGWTRWRAILAQVFYSRRSCCVPRVVSAESYSPSNHSFPNAHDLLASNSGSGGICHCVLTAQALPYTSTFERQVDAHRGHLARLQVLSRHSSKAITIPVLCLVSSLHPHGPREICAFFIDAGNGKGGVGKEDLARMAGGNGAFVVTQLIARVIKDEDTEEECRYLKVVFDKKAVTELRRRSPKGLTSFPSSLESSRCKYVVVVVGIL